MVSSIQLSFHLTKTLQGDIGLVWSQEAVSQGRGYLPVCLGQLSGHGPTGRDSLGMSGQNHCSCHSSAVSCKGCSELLCPGLPGRSLLIWTALQLSEVSYPSEISFRGILQLLGSGHAMSIPLLPSLGGHRLQLTYTSLLSQASLPFRLCFIASTIPINNRRFQPRIGKEQVRG